MGIFVWWFADPSHIGYKPIFWLLTVALLFKLVKMLHEWYHYWSLSIPEAPVLKTKFTADVLTTACPGEPREMIIRTLRAMVEIRYPHTNYLCDEGNDPILKKVCEELGVIHVTRTDKSNAKAGNINNALKQATGDICVVLDPDHIPVPEFLDRTIAYFENPEIGFVQCVQGYYNQDESIIAKGAAEQTYHFYGPMMMCMNTYGTVQAIGANCTFRRSALDSIGGHAAGLSEDMHTAMQLHAKGWKSIYIPEMLTKGLVPATLSAYYKQQLKWSRGTFDLLFNQFPKLFKQFTWRQKLHYFTIPLYFLFGLINFIDILIPLVALSLAQVPWEVNIADFGMFFIPLCCLSMVIRLYAQRWLLEKHERGFHLAGGILRTATWWIFLIGFIYAIFNVKVPYIPTPKEDEHQNYVKLSLPNIIIALICSAGILYGLQIDWSPYSIAMASYALMNAGMLFFIVMMSQQKWLDAVTKKVKAFSLLNYFSHQTTSYVTKVQHAFYGLLRNGPVALLIGSALLFFSYSSVDNDDKKTALPNQKEIGGFFTGITLNGQINTQYIPTLESLYNNKFEILSFNEQWNSDKNINNCFSSKLATIPMLTWQLPAKDSMWKHISSGSSNLYLRKVAREIREYGKPVFINFAPGFDTYSPTEKNSPQEFVLAWQHVYTFFNNLGISNLTWVWSPKYSNSMAFYPGPKFTDWVGVSCLNYAHSGEKDRYSFSQIYSPFRDKYNVFLKPVMITELGSVKDKTQKEWLDEALRSIKEKYHEVHAAVLFDQQKTGINAVNADTKYVTNFDLKHSDCLSTIVKNFDELPYRKNVFIANNVTGQIKAKYTSQFIKGEPGKFQLVINGKPFYIRGVAYNTAHDWRDGNMPLTRRQVEKDMQKIKEMGGNLIRRYDHGIYDHNILTIAEENQMNVLYGFWFDPKTDFYKDSVKVKEYMDQVIEKVEENKGQSSILAWSLGNETWGLLKHNFAKPYLTTVRQCYVNMIEVLAERIHQIDPTRPVFSSMEHEEYQLPGEVVAFHDGAPSLDAIGINSYYKEQISNLNRVLTYFDPQRPYVVTEFGPRGYWDPTHNRYSNGLLVEDSEQEKAAWYSYQWKNYIEANKGNNIGGIAYCWHDRMEGSRTWFGLTDYMGRTKPAYYALKEAWMQTGEQPIPEFKIHVPQQVKPGEEYVFTATSSTVSHKEFKYEWSVNKDSYLKDAGGITQTDEDNTVVVKIPETKAEYRLYLYVSDDNGNVSTTSVPIKVF
jgi:cellulose synthase/poly-beta-1,6-N-acetylglucosamine synthase-like glycosyltransferase